MFTIETKINYTSIKKRYNATCDNYFTSIELSLRFEKKKTAVSLEQFTKIKKLFEPAKKKKKSKTSY